MIKNDDLIFGNNFTGLKDNQLSKHSDLFSHPNRTRNVSDVKN